MSLAWELARRFRRHRSSHRFTSFISVSSTFGIALGCMVLITALSMMNGFQQVLESRFLKLIPHVEFNAVEGQIKDWRRVAEIAQSDPRVTAVQPLISTQVLVQQGTEFKGLQVLGVDSKVEEIESPHAIREFMSAQAWQRLQETHNGVVLGHGIAKELAVDVGDSLVVMSSAGGQFKQPQRFRLQVVGLFEFGGELDYQQAYTDLTTARALIGAEQGVTSVALQINDVFAAQSVALSIGRKIEEFVYLDHWIRTQGHLYRDIQLVRTVLYLVLILVLAVACFNIVSSLVMTVKEKQGHIAILKTMGMRNAQIIRVFVWQGMQTGLIGLTIGTLLGVLLATNLPHLIEAVETMIGHSMLDGQVYFVDKIPSELRLFDVLLVVGVGLILCFAATFYPAWRAAKIDPAQAIHQA